MDQQIETFKSRIRVLLCKPEPIVIDKLEELERLVSKQELRIKELEHELVVVKQDIVDHQ